MSPLRVFLLAGLILVVFGIDNAKADEGDLQTTISGDEGSTSYASENGTAVFTVDISSASDAAHTNVDVSVSFDDSDWESDQATIDDCNGGNDYNFSAGGSSTACISVEVERAESVGGSVEMSVSVTSDEDTSGTSVHGLIKISNWMVSSEDGVQSYSENETHDYTITVTNLRVDADGAGIDLDEPVYIRLVVIGGGWNVDSSSSAWDKPSLTATINFIPADGSVDLVLEIQLVGGIVLSSSYTGAPASIGFVAFDESETPFTTFIFLQAEVATFNRVAITSLSDETDAWDPSTTEVDNGCSGSDVAIDWDVSVFNFGNDRDSFDVTFNTSDAGSAGWTVSGADTFTTELLEPRAHDGVHTIQVGLIVPTGLAAGITHGFSMTATSTVDNSISQTQTFSATVAQCYGLDMTVDSMMNGANPGSSTDFTITISNTGNGDDTFTYVTMGAAAWNPSLASAETVISSGATGQNVLSVTVPADASSDAVSGMIMVHAYSEACGDDRIDCDYEASITVSVSANQVFDLTAGYYSNETEVVKSSASVEEGMSVQMKITVTNNGNGIDQVTLSLANAPSWVSISDDPILIGPGLTETVSITITAPASGAEGDHTFQVTATSSDNTVTSTTGELTVTITGGGTGTGPTTDDLIEGCIDTEAKNYNQTAEIDDGSCEYYVEGCMNSTAVNYLPEAEIDDNSCKYGPTAIAGKNITVIEGEIVQFSGAGIDSDGTVIKYEWDFDGDGIFEWSSDDNGLATFFYNDGGEYFTKLRVTDNEGNTAVDDRKILVIADVDEGLQGTDDGELSSLSLLTSLILVGLIAIFRRK